MNLVKCQCEHIAHFERDKRTPNGNPAHSYGVAYSDRFITRVATSYGVFTVCLDCAKDCHSEAH